MSKHINEENQFVKNCSNCFIPINSTYYIFCCHCGGKATKKICKDKKFVQIVIYKRLTLLIILGLWSVFVVVMLQLYFAQHV